ncbi:MAG: thioredoxin [Verrucomicrobiota bacterium]
MTESVRGSPWQSTTLTQFRRIMASGSLLELNDQNFEQEVINSEIPVLVDFWAEWCGPCKMIAPLLEEIASETEGTYKVGKVDIDTNQELAAKFQVRSIPTLLFFKGGEVKDTVVGATTPKAGLLGKLEAL